MGFSEMTPLIEQRPLHFVYFIYRSVSVIKACSSSCEPRGALFSGLKTETVVYRAWYHLKGTHKLSVNMPEILADGSKTMTATALGGVRLLD